MEIFIETFTIDYIVEGYAMSIMLNLLIVSLVQTIIFDWNLRETWSQLGFPAKAVIVVLFSIAAWGVGHFLDVAIAKILKK